MDRTYYVYDDHESAGNILRIVLLIAVVAIFIFLILKDAVKALRRRAHWIPGDFLVLSAFIIQLLNLVSAQGSPNSIPKEIPNRNDSIDDNPEAMKALRTLSSDFWMIHTSRIMLCVVVANMMPGMANPGSEGSWGRLMALALTIFLHISSEVYLVYRNSFFFTSNYFESCSGVACNFYIPFAILALICFVILILHLGCANIAGRGIERIIAQKIPLILKGQGEPADSAHHHQHHHSCWSTVEEAARRTITENADHRQTCCRIVEDVVLAAQREKEKEEVEHLHPRCQQCWRSVEDTVLRAWIVSRAYSLEYIIARSALASSAAIIVTLQILITIFGGVEAYSNMEWPHWYDQLRLTATILQCIFISIGWLIVIWRWVTSVTYYRKWQSDTWRSGFKLEDFWTRHLRELLQAREPRLAQAEALDTKISSVVAKEQITFSLPTTLLYVVVGLQWLTVTFSKACWLASLVIWHNKVMNKLMSCILSKHVDRAFKQYKKYEKTLKGVQMLGETPESLWLANRKSIAKAKELISQGKQDGESSCEDLVQFLVSKRTGYGLGRQCLDPYKRQCLDPYKQQADSVTRTGQLTYLCQNKPIHQQPKEATDNEKQQQPDEENGLLLAVEEYFADVSTKSWKMTAVSLLSIIVQLSPMYAAFDDDFCAISHEFPPKAVKDCLLAYSQAWEIVDFVEETDTEANGITGQAADKFFDILQRKAKKGTVHGSNFRHARPHCVRTALDDLKNQCKSGTVPNGSLDLFSKMIHAVGIKDKIEIGERQSKLWKTIGGNDSLNWKVAASCNAVYKLCNSIQCSDETDVSELLKELVSSLADIINECLEKSQYLLLLNSKKWARKGDEKKMGKALYTAGKAKKIMNELDKEIKEKQELDKKIKEKQELDKKMMEQHNKIIVERRELDKAMVEESSESAIVPN